MLNTIRLMFIALFMGAFLVACGDSNQDVTEEATAPAAESEMAAEAPATEATDAVSGMTEEEAVAKWGEPDLKQSYSIDSLTYTYYEWHGEEGITAVQFQNGVAQHSQSIAAE